MGQISPRTTARSSRGKLYEKQLIFFYIDSVFEKYFWNLSLTQPDNLKDIKIGRGVSDGPKLYLPGGRAEQRTTKRGNSTMLLDENLQCDCDSFQARLAGGSTQGPASEILATETATGRKGEGETSQHPRGLDSRQSDTPLPLFYSTAFLLTSNSPMALCY